MLKGAYDVVSHKTHTVLPCTDSAVCGAILATMPVETAFANATDPSTYQDSCTCLGVTGATLTAVCRRKDGSFNDQTTIRIRGIDNVNGKLTYSK
jgi:hypothetical protein